MCEIYPKLRIKKPLRTLVSHTFTFIQINRYVYVFLKHDDGENVRNNAQNTTILKGSKKNY